MAMEKMLAQPSTCRYPVSRRAGSPKSRVVVMSEPALTERLAADPFELNLIDGLHFAESCCVVALDIDIEGNKHPLAGRALDRDRPLIGQACPVRALGVCAA